MEPAARYIVRVLEDGEWKNWGSCDSLVEAHEAIHGENQWSPVVGKGVASVPETHRRC
jgi:hypothetical protein